MRVPTPYGPYVAKILICRVFFLLFYFQPAFALQQYGKQKVTIVGNDISMGNVFNQIEKQTGMRFMYASGILNFNKKVKVAFQQNTLDDVLHSLLNSEGILWQYREGTILLKQGKSKVDLNENADHSDDQDIKGYNLNGRITDLIGTPIPGASVLVKGTQKGVQSNVDGNFKISDVNVGDILLITSVGFETKEILIKGQETLYIKLKPAIGVLDEAVVIAYGKASNRILTGNVSVVKAEEIARSPVMNPLLALSGRVPGLDINQKSGFAGAGVATLIQGQNSISSGNDPFYVVDGVPYPSQGLSVTGTMLGVSGTNTSAKGNTLSYINPSDIESITVLKDADATAIYGSRAANGAILITTKKGKVGATKIGVDYQQGVGKVSRRMDVMNTPQYLEMRHEAILNDGGSVGPMDYDINGTWDTTRDTDWQKEYIGRTAQYITANASISGGSSALQYFIGGTYHRESSVMIGNGNNQKGAIHFNLNNSSSNNKFQLQLSGNYVIDNNKLPNADFTTFALTTPPNAPKLYKDDGSLNFMPTADGTITFFNPLIELNKKFNTLTKNLVSNLMLSYNILPGLNIRSSFGYTDMNSNELVTYPLSSNRPDLIPFSLRAAAYGTYSLTSWIIEPQLNYNRTFGVHKFDFLLGSSVQRNNGKGNEITGTDYNTDEALGDMNSAVTLKSTLAQAYVYKYAGLFGRLNYILSDKYVINLSARRDGSSRFGSANRFHNFTAVGAAWIFSSEDFIKNNIPFLSYGKVRFSYGTTGNDQIGDYKFLNLYTPVPVGVPYRGLVGLQSTGLSNPYLQWEETKKTNFGLDLGIQRDRFILNANYYINRSSNQLLPYLLPSISGETSIITNYPATVQNMGWEFTLNANVVKTEKLNWTISTNVTLPRNKLIEFKNIQSSSYAQLYKIGQPITVTNVFKYAGVDPENGKYLFDDGKGGVTSDPEYSNIFNNVVNTGPKWYGGINSSLSYAGFTLDMLFSYMKRNGANYFAGASFPGANRTNQPAFLLDRWKKTGDVAGHQRYNADYSLAGQWVYAFLSDASYSNASYCRLKNLALSYQVPISWVKYAHLSSIRIYAQAQNLFTFTKYKGLDPETLSSINLPPLKVYVFGLQASF